MGGGGLGGGAAAEAIARNMPVTWEERVEDIECCCITNASGVVVRCISLGATLTQMKLPDG